MTHSRESLKANLEAERATLNRMRALTVDPLWDVLRSRPNLCPQCNGALRLATEHTERGTGVIVIILGLLLAPLCLGIPILIYGFVMVSRIKQYWHCAGCGRTFPA